MDEQFDVESLKQHGFTDEELAGLTPKTEVSSETVTDVKIETEDVEPIVDSDTTDNSQSDGETVSKLKPTVVAYDRFKEINDKNKLLAAELAALKAAQTPTPTPTPQPAPQQPVQQSQQPNISEQISKAADEKVRKELEITDDIETLQYTDPKKYLQYVKNVAKEEFKMESQYEKQVEIYSQNLNFVNDLKTQKDFPVLYQFAIAELDEMPGKKSKVISAAFDRINSGVGSKEDIATIKDFTNECRTKMTGINTPPTPSTPAPAPLTTSPLDKAAGLPRATGLSGAKTSAMSWAQVEDLIRQGKSDQIPKEMLRQIDPKLVI